MDLNYGVSKMVFYAQSTGPVIPGRELWGIDKVAIHAEKVIPYIKLKKDT